MNSNSLNKMSSVGEIGGTSAIHDVTKVATSENTLVELNLLGPGKVRDRISVSPTILTPSILLTGAVSGTAIHKLEVSHNGLALQFPQITGNCESHLFVDVHRLQLSIHYVGQISEATGNLVAIYIPGNSSIKTTAEAQLRKMYHLTESKILQTIRNGAAFCFESASLRSPCKFNNVIGKNSAFQGSEEILGNLYIFYEGGGKLETEGALQLTIKADLTFSHCIDLPKLKEIESPSLSVYNKGTTVTSVFYNDLGELKISLITPVSDLNIEAPTKTAGVYRMRDPVDSIITVTDSILKNINQNFKYQ